MTLPLYVYRCAGCGHEFEQIVKMADPNPPCPKIIQVTEDTQTFCRECGQPTTKLIGGSAFHLKGSGWASDGYS